MAAGRILLAAALLGFGLENILFGRYIVARVAPWPDDPSLRFVVACATGALLLVSGAALSKRFVRPAALASAGLIFGWSMWRHLPVAVAGPAWSGHWTNATLIPPFIPGALFWTYVAGILLIGAGLGFWIPAARPRIAPLAALMVFSWVFLVHVPLVVRVGRAEWMGVFEALGISSVCLAVAARQAPS